MAGQVLLQVAALSEAFAALAATVRLLATAAVHPAHVAPETDAAAQARAAVDALEGATGAIPLRGVLLARLLAPLASPVDQVEVLLQVHPGGESHRALQAMLGRLSGLLGAIVRLGRQDAVHLGF